LQTLVNLKIYLIKKRIKMKEFEQDIHQEDEELQKTFVRRDDGQEHKVDVVREKLTANPGDRIADHPQSLAEKAQQLAVDSPDITGDHIQVPTYFVFEFSNGEKKALHHVKDANEISDLIRIMRLQNDDWW
jgi:hypothetical protein